MNVVWLMIDAKCPREVGRRKKFAFASKVNCSHQFHLFYVKETVLFILVILNSYSSQLFGGK